MSVRYCTPWREITSETPSAARAADFFRPVSPPGLLSDRFVGYHNLGYPAGVGTIIGERTWGGLIGIGGYPSLLDGGGVTAPRWAIYGLKGQWEVENHGVAPDIEVMMDPKLVREGHDPQLERGLEVVLDLLKKNPPPSYPKPPFPNYHETLPQPVR